MLNRTTIILYILTIFTFLHCNKVETINSNNFNPFAGSKPIFIIIETEPWAAVLEAETPKLVLYENRELIYYNNDNNNKREYVYIKLSKNEFNSLKNLYESININLIKDYYNLYTTIITDQPSTLIIFKSDNKLFHTRIYGLGYSNKEDIGYSISHKFKGSQLSIIRRPGGIPKSLQKLYLKMIDLDIEGAKKWSPKYIEIMIWPFEYAKKSIKWPNSWPNLNSKFTIKRNNNSFSIFLQQKEYENFLEFYKKVDDDRTAIIIDNKKWALEYRLVFPSEPYWK